MTSHVVTHNGTTTTALKQVIFVFFISFFSNQKIQINKSIRATPGAAHDLRPLCTCLGRWWGGRGHRRKRISGFQAVII